MIIEKIIDVRTPEKREEDSGYDFYIPNSLSDSIIYPGDNIVIPLGIKIQLPKGYDMTLTNRSSIASKKSLVVGACIIDNGYRGELMVDIHNIGTQPQLLSAGDKIVQGIVRKTEHFDIIEGIVNIDTERGEGGFGSTN